MNFKTVLENAKTATLIGSREPPERIANIAIKIGRALSDRDIVAYSGGAPGMDSHFLFDYAPEKRRIILPENGFNGLYSNGMDIIDYNELDTYKAADEARKVAGHFDNQTEWVQRRYARNAVQILRETLDNPTDFVLFWAVEKEFCVQGGTAIATRLARLYGVPSFNLWKENVLNDVCDTLGINIKPPTLDFLWC
nr:hypothetical protein [Citrobacter phage vB_Cfr_Xman]